MVGRISRNAPQGVPLILWRLQMWQDYHTKSCKDCFILYGTCDPKIWRYLGGSNQITWALTSREPSQAGGRRGKRRESKLERDSAHYSCFEMGVVTWEGMWVASQRRRWPLADSWQGNGDPRCTSLQRTEFCPNRHEFGRESWAPEEHAACCYFDFSFMRP